MFICEPCRVRRRWPSSIVPSRGKCEVCGGTAVCHSVPSSKLSDDDPAPGPRCPRCGSHDDCDCGLPCDHKHN